MKNNWKGIWFSDGHIEPWGRDWLENGYITNTISFGIPFLLFIGFIALIIKIT